MSFKFLAERNPVVAMKGVKRKRNAEDISFMKILFTLTAEEAFLDRWQEISGCCKSLVKAGHGVLLLAIHSDFLLGGSQVWRSN